MSGNLPDLKITARSLGAGAQTTQRVAILKTVIIPTIVLARLPSCLARGTGKPLDP